MTGNRARPHRLLLVGGLFLLAPLVGEYLFGNIAITELPFVLVLASLYGGGAVLIREVARRTGRGWPTMLLLALAYGLFEEGPVDQMLWNPHYGGIKDFGLSYAGTYVEWLGTSVQLLQDVVSLHTVWSICVPIALVEAFDRGRPRPWLGRTGLIIVASVFVLGSLFLAVAQIDADGFVASAAQYAGTSAVILTLVVAVFVVDRRPLPRLDATAPSPWLVGAFSFVAAGLVVARQYLPESVSAWLVATGWFVLVAFAGALVLRWSRSRGWGGQHRLALAGGALLTYAWLGFQQARYLDVSRTTALIGNAVFGIGAVGLLILAARRQRSEGAQPVADQPDVTPPGRDAGSPSPPAL
ncbi:hypothetical protein [Actinoplanes auranticolor]|uniref:DUF998 domain-containing protein n=1 Tax=Actinoplanes auranticolor TaxID=47988 RepID=A0A919SA83_9ACTN|nr:hypothetical protein [Actinoplanes auranticolor]GIM67742.1 hypothetical protein Aau02nite_28680 [Actinoplanes auranticolor]